MNKILSLESVSAGYADEIVLKDVTLDILSHDFVGIIGPNGGGKTTLLKVMMGLIKPVKGSVNFPGAARQGLRNLFGYLPQLSKSDNKFPITVSEVVLSGLTKEDSWINIPSRKEKEIAIAMMEKTGIYHLKDKVIGELSGGQMQRAFLARAIISSPYLLVLDEPNTYVDSNFEKDLYELLLEFNKEMAIIVVSHDLGMVSSYVKTIACVNRGLHYHHSNIITEELMNAYNCPIDLIAHGELPHRILKEHSHHDHDHH
ncbi:MAG: ABC transporter ATP-binding protein [Bacteroidota bacterium]